MNNCFFLNLQCGADFVKIRQAVPHGMPTIEPYTRCVSIDGDADRIIYFFTDEKNQFFLLDGDRIATLYAGYVTTPILALLICNENKFFFFRYLMDLVTKVGIKLKLGIVQTAYANGGSTDYIQQELVSFVRYFLASILCNFNILTIFNGLRVSQ